jgi:ubiquinone/menaquinone biosynthesis C-methylase UbiE
MEGVIATWYARNTGRDMARFTEVARLVADRVRPGGAVLEVAPGPGYLSIEIAKRGYAVTALDISKSFVRIARENGAREGVDVDVRLGNAAAMPFAVASFDFVVCMAAFKNFSEPVAAINEMHRVLKPGGEALIIDLRKEASLRDIADEVRNMHLSAWNALVTRFIFRHGLLRAAYTVDQLTEIANKSTFGGGEVTPKGIGFEFRLRKDQSFAADERMSGEAPQWRLPR